MKQPTKYTQIPDENMPVFAQIKDWSIMKGAIDLLTDYEFCSGMEAEFDPRGLPLALGRLGVYLADNLQKLSWLQLRIAIRVLYGISRYAYEITDHPYPVVEWCHELTKTLQLFVDEQKKDPNSSMGIINKEGKTTSDVVREAYELLQKLFSNQGTTQDNLTLYPIKLNHPLYMVRLWV